MFLLLWLQRDTLAAQTADFSTNNTTENPGEITEVVFSVDPRNNKINKIFLQEGSTEQQLYQLKQECYRCRYYTGNLQGTFQIKRNFIIPQKGARITINSGKDIMTAEQFKPGGNFRPGSIFLLAGIKTTVVSNKQNILILSVN